MPRHTFSLLISRSTVFRSLYRSASWLTGRPPLGPLLLPVGGLVVLLRDDGLDAASAHVGSVAAGRISLVARDGVGPGAGAANGPVNPDLLQDGDELRAVGSLAGGQDERQRATLTVGGEVNLTGLPASRTPEEGGEHVLTKMHPGGGVVGARGGGFDADQRQVHLASLRGVRNQALQ